MIKFFLECFNTWTILRVRVKLRKDMVCDKPYISLHISHISLQFSSISLHYTSLASPAYRIRDICDTIHFLTTIGKTIFFKFILFFLNLTLYFSSFNIFSDKIFLHTENILLKYWNVFALTERTIWKRSSEWGWIFAPTLR